MGIRRLVQWLSTLIHNAYLPGFLRLTIYQGPLKGACVPILNCYSCPGALGSCPVGAMQFFLASFRHQASLYVGGLATFVGAMGGRWVCGWLCPFGLIQELLARGKRVSLPKGLALIKYPVLILTLILPVLWVGLEGMGSPYYCKYICPAGTLEAGLPLGLGRPEFHSLLGAVFVWKTALLLIVLLTAVFIYRPFCRTFCPLGAYYGLFNKISIWRLEREPHLCTSCGVCQQVCPMEIDVCQNPNSPECIRCLKCRDACPSSSLNFVIHLKEPVSDDESSRV